jgi:DNA mismatch repair protein PMS2
MVGTALSITEMGRIIKQLAVTSQPWTCAHGRPTMQHVGNFKSLVTQDEDRASAHVAGPTVTMPTQSEEVEAEH